MAENLQQRKSGRLKGSHREGGNAEDEADGAELDRVEATVASAGATDHDPRNMVAVKTATQDGGLLAKFRGQLDAGDYGEDDVRSLALHVFIFTSVFFAAIDSYIFISGRAMEQDALGPGVGRIITVSLFGFVCFVVVLGIWPLYYANHTRYSRLWLFVTLGGALAILAYRANKTLEQWDEIGEPMRIFQVVEIGFVVLTVLSILLLGAEMACRGRNFVPYSARRDAALKKGLEKATASRVSGAVNRDPARASGGGLGQFLWPSSDVPGRRDVPITYSSKLYLATLLSFAVCITITIVLFRVADEVEKSLSKLPDVFASVSSAASVVAYFEGPRNAAHDDCAAVLRFRDADWAPVPDALEAYCAAVLAPPEKGGGVGDAAQALYAQYVYEPPSGTGEAGVLEPGTEIFAEQQSMCRGVGNFPSAEKALLSCAQFEKGFANGVDAGGVIKTGILDQVDGFLDSFGVFDLVDAAQGTFPERVVMGLEVGAIGGMAWCVYACVLAFRAWRKKMINHHFEAHAFAYVPQRSPHRFQLRFVSTFVSYVAWGYVFTDLLVTIVAIVWPFVNVGFGAAWPYVVSYLAYYAILLGLRFVVLPKFVIDEDEMIDRRWFKFCSICLELFYFPLSLFTGLSTFVLVNVIAIFGYLRPDVCVMPAGMESWDLGHTTFVAAIRFHYRYVYYSKTDEAQWVQEHWKAKKDWVSGKTYYEHAKTGKKQWTRPHWRPGKKHRHKKHSHHKHGNHDDNADAGHAAATHHSHHKHGDDATAGHDDENNADAATHHSHHKKHHKHHGKKHHHGGGHGAKPFKHLQSEARLVEGIKKAKDRLAAEGGLDTVAEEGSKPRKSKHPHHGHKHKHAGKKHHHRKHKTVVRTSSGSVKKGTAGSRKKLKSNRSGGTVRAPSAVAINQSEHDLLGAAAANAAESMKKRLASRRASLNLMLAQQRAASGTKRVMPAAAGPAEDQVWDGDGLDKALAHEERDKAEARHEALVAKQQSTEDVFEILDDVKGSFKIDTTSVADASSS